MKNGKVVSVAMAVELRKRYRDAYDGVIPAVSPLIRKRGHHLRPDVKLQKRLAVEYGITPRVVYKVLSHRIWPEHHCKSLTQ